MKLNLLPSLLESASVKVCAILWNCWADERCVTYWSNPYDDTEPGRAWLTIEADIKAKIPELGLPSSLEKEVARFIKPLGGEILKWCKLHCPGGYLDVNIGLPNEFCWTSLGTINMKRTAEGVVKDENLCLDTRHRLALFYCLESDILELCLGCRYSSHEHNRRAVERELTSFWNCFPPEEAVPQPEVIEHRDYVCAFLAAADCGNIEAMKYFWKKLTPPEQNQSAIYAVRRLLADYNSSRTCRFFCKKFYSEVLCFLLLQLNDEQQMDVVIKHSSDIVLWFVNWPCQSVVMEIVNLISESISPYACHRLLIEIANRVSKGDEYYDYPELFTKVWLQVSDSCKQEVLRNYAEPLMIKLLKIKDFKNIKLILEDVDPVEKERYVLFCGINCFLMNRNNCDLFEQFIQEFIPLKKDIVVFKKKFEKAKLPVAPVLFLNLLDSLIREDDKRKCTDEDYGNSCKKLDAQDQAMHNA